MTTALSLRLASDETLNELVAQAGELLAEITSGFYGADEAERVGSWAREVNAEWDRRFAARPRFVPTFEDDGGPF